ncbi:glycolipid transfer protein [Trifolium repens]|nr:glycolipid transfer protein [Trifolium repens]
MNIAPSREVDEAVRKEKLFSEGRFSSLLILFITSPVAMKLAPDRKKFMEVIQGGADVNADIEKFCTTFSPYLEENHKFLARFGLDDMKAS